MLILLKPVRKENDFLIPDREVWGILLIWLVIGGLAITLFIRSESIGLSILVLVCVTFAWYWLLWAIFGGLNRIVAH